MRGESFVNGSSGETTSASPAKPGPVVCCLNNYPLNKMRARAVSGAQAGQHQWGIDALDRAGFRVRLAPFSEPGDANPLDRLSRALHWRAGRLDQELWAVRSHPDIVYCADQASANGLALIGGKSLKACIIHHPLGGSRVVRRALSRYQVRLAISGPVAAELTAQGLTTRPVTWGPDLEFQGYSRDGLAIGSGPLVVSSGKSNRDVALLMAALERVHLPAVVYDIHNQVPNAPDHVTLVRAGGQGEDPGSAGGYLPQRVLSDLRTASVVAIPIARADRLTGLTEVNDALALGKPMVVTRTPYDPIDVEAIGCGFSVEVGDLDGWVSALAALKDPDLAQEMGERGRAFAETSWNYRLFSQQLVQALQN